MIYLSLGSNLGDREARLRMALEKLQQRGILLVKESSIYETEPVDVPDQPDFLNLVCQVETVLEPESLLATCQEIEFEMGRRRGEDKGGRNIDIDILFYGRRIVEKPFLSDFRQGDEHEVSLPGGRETSCSSPWRKSLRIFGIL